MGPPEWVGNVDQGRGGGWFEPLDVLLVITCLGRAPVLMPGSEEVTQLPPVPRSSDLPFRGCEKLGAFSKASFKTDTSVGKNHECVCQGPRVFVVHLFLSLVTLSYLFSPILHSSFKSCYYVSFSFVSGFLTQMLWEPLRSLLLALACVNFLPLWV